MFDEMNFDDLLLMECAKFDYVSSCIFFCVVLVKFVSINDLILKKYE